MPKTLAEVPSSQAGRIRWVAELLYPLGRWRIHIAQQLGIGRSSLYRHLARQRPVPGIDDSLMLLMARERIAAHRRARDIAQAERAFAQEMGRTASTLPARNPK